MASSDSLGTPARPGHVDLPGHLDAEMTSILDRRIRPILISTLTAAALASFDGLGVTAAQSAIGADLGRVGLLSWVFAAFSLTLTVAAVAAGPVIDRLGLRVAYRLTLATFFVGAVLCTFAPTMETLIAARALQGIGGGMIFSVSLAAVGITFPAHLRPRAFAANAMVWGAMSFAGPGLAAILVSAFGWRAVFAVNLPLTALAAAIAWSRLPGPSPSEEPAGRFDVTGLALIALFASLVLLATTELDRRSLLTGGLAIAVVVVAWRMAGRHPNPVLDRKYLVRMPEAGLNWAMFTLFGGGLAVETFVPLFVQGGLAHSAKAGAFSVTFMALGWTVASYAVARLLERIEETAVMMGGFLVALAPLLVGLAVYGAKTPLWLVALNSFVQGGGIGGTSNAAVTLLQKQTPPEEMGRASAAHQFVRNLGSTIGVAAAGGVLFGFVDRRLGSLDPIQPLLKGEESATVADATRRAVADAYRWTHVLAVVLVAAGFVTSLRIRRWIALHR